MKKIKKDIKIIRRKGLYYLMDENNRIKKYKPWLHSIFCFIYDRIMRESVFPKKFNGSYKRHIEILKREFKPVHKKEILEIGTGTGNLAKALQRDMFYTGLDISAGLLNIASSNFEKYCFPNIELFVADASDMPFKANSFDRAVCNLSLNFFPEKERFIKELSRVLKPGGVFFCSVPVPEKISKNARIKGNLLSEEDLKKLFQKYGFAFKPCNYENGAMLYFYGRLFNLHYSQTNVVKFVDVGGFAGWMQATPH